MQPLAVFLISERYNANCGDGPRPIPTTNKTRRFSPNKNPATGNKFRLLIILLHETTMYDMVIFELVLKLLGNILSVFIDKTRNPPFRPKCFQRLVRHCNRCRRRRRYCYPALDRRPFLRGPRPFHRRCSRQCFLVFLS